MSWLYPIHGGDCEKKGVGVGVGVGVGSGGTGRIFLKTKAQHGCVFSLITYYVI